MIFGPASICCVVSSFLGASDYAPKSCSELDPAKCFIALVPGEGTFAIKMKREVA